MESKVYGDENPALTAVVTGAVMAAIPSTIP
jgi:hypothetical protein